MAAAQNWSNTPQPPPGVPEPYDLDIIQKSWFGLPFYHFRTDWKASTGFNPQYSMYNLSGGPALVGERVKVWSNTYMGGIGNAYIEHEDQYFGRDVYPTLVEVNGKGKSLRGLAFDGRTYLAIDGSEVVDNYNLTNPLYTTSGSIYTDKAVTTGASFLMVVSASPEIRQNSYDPELTGCYRDDDGCWRDCYGIGANAALIYGARPVTGFPPYQIPGGGGSTWLDENGNVAPGYFESDLQWCQEDEGNGCGPICGPVDTADIPVEQKWKGELWGEGKSIDDDFAWQTACGDWKYQATGWWPKVENQGLVWLYSGGSDRLGCYDGWGGGPLHQMKFGPAAYDWWGPNVFNQYIGHIVERRTNDWPRNSWGGIAFNPFNGSGVSSVGGSLGGYLNPPNNAPWSWYPSSNRDKKQSVPKTGFQALLLEFRGAQHCTHQKDYIGPKNLYTRDFTWPPGNANGAPANPIFNYTGPIVNVYAISEDWLEGVSTDGPEGCPGFGNKKENMIYPAYTNEDIGIFENEWNGGNIPQHALEDIAHSYPAPRDHTLWHDKFIFLGGLPAIPGAVDPKITSGPPGSPAQYTGPLSPQGHGFKGILFEFLAFEGVLTPQDKVKLFTILKQKYAGYLGPQDI